jgi:tagatose 6-phosphate kinase
MILCLGTTPALQRTMTFASLTQNAVNRAVEVREYASGKSINVARVAHTLGADVIATGLLGGRRAHAVRSDLDVAGVAHDFVDVDAPTRMCVTVIDQSQNTATELVEESSTVEPADGDRLLLHLDPLLARAKVMVLSGTLAPGIGTDFYRRCVMRAREQHISTIVDARGDGLRLAMEQRPLIVKTNRAELAATLDCEIPDESALRAAMRRCAALGASWVITTDGERDTLLFGDSHFFRVTTPRVKVISPIGSGDALAAGLAAGLCDVLQVPQACVLGVACGAANAQTANAGHVDRRDVERLRQSIKVCQFDG